MDGIFLQQMINGLTLRSVYGLIAIGYTVVYGIIGMINFAHGGVHDLRLPVGHRPPCWPSSACRNFPLLILGTLLFTVR